MERRETCEYSDQAGYVALNKDLIEPLLDWQIITEIKISSPYRFINGGWKTRFNISQWRCMKTNAAVFVFTRNCQNQMTFDSHEIQDQDAVEGIYYGGHNIFEDFMDG